MTVSYSNRFQQKDVVASYETNEYGKDSYSTSIWQMQRPVVEQLLKNFRETRSEPVRLLDFACGTGRVLSVLEPVVDSADGVDISENMVAIARTRCNKARLLVGDILSSPELLQKQYDVISCFRFILNVEPEIRVQILRRLRQAIRQPDGLLLVNVHGNSHSLRHPSIMWRRWRERNGKGNVMLNEMSPTEARSLLRESGFEIVRQFGFGVLPATIYRTPLRRVAQAMDRQMAGDHYWSNWAIDILFVCRPC
jgi:SAM-dependent methyltransferase